MSDEELTELVLTMLRCGRCTRRQLQAEVVPPLDPSAGAVEQGGDGLRAPASTQEQLQRRTVEGIHDSMRLANAACQAWRTANGAVAAWNAAFPLLRARRFADALPLLLPALQLLVQPGGAGAPPGGAGAGAAPAPASGTAAGAAAGSAPPAPAPADYVSERRRQLSARLAESVAKGAEHAALLQLLRPAAAAAGEGAWRGLVFRKGVTPWYGDLQEARQRAGAGRHAGCGGGRPQRGGAARGRDTAHSLAACDGAAGGCTHGWRRGMRPGC